MAYFTCKPVKETQIQLSFFTRCKYSTLRTFKFHHLFNISPTEHASNQRFSSFLKVGEHITHLGAKLPGENVSRYKITCKASDLNSSGLSSSSAPIPNDRKVGQSSLLRDSSSAVDENFEKRVVLKESHAKSRLKNQNGTAIGPQFSSVRSNDEGAAKRTEKTQNEKSRDEHLGKKLDKGHVNGQEKVVKSSKKSKGISSGTILRVGLDMCSKRGDVIGAIRLYDLARKEEAKLGQYHYAVLLYLCSSAAAGVVLPAKSGNSSRSLNPLGLSKEIPCIDSAPTNQFDLPRKRNFGINQSDSGFMVEDSDKKGSNFGEFSAEIEVYDSKSTISKNPMIISNGFSEPYPQTLEVLVQFMKSNADYEHTKNVIRGQVALGIQVNKDVKMYALKRGFEIYETMLSEKVPMNEATFTSVARMAMSLGDGDMAFDIVKQMKESGLSPRLRSYGPALTVFCNNGDVEKAFSVEEHMLENGVYPEEPELEALLRVSVEAERSDKVYQLLHKLRTNVRQVSPCAADLIAKWFRSNLASKVGKKKWSQRMIREAVQNGGGGWHGQGWVGKGKWTVSHTSVGSDGSCKFCGEKLVTIDLNSTETELFARSVASLALQREKNSNFENFQKWLDYYGPFEAVVDGANVGLYSQRNFKPSKVNAIVNGIRQMLPSKRLPLIVLHNRRITGDHKMNEPVNKALIEKWKNADALYATPTGSNDDWYWLYAAIKFKCLIVTNDEMRDHLFQLLGKDFFPIWKERHQVHFSFSETGPAFHMPPPCSIVIQESERGHWHIPIASEYESHWERTWLCITRPGSRTTHLESSVIHDDSHNNPDKKQRASSGIGMKMVSSKQSDQETYKNLKKILSSSLLSESHSILQDLESAEHVGGCTIDFQI